MAEKSFEVSATGKATIQKAPGARKDYGVDLTTRLAPGDAVDESKLTVDSEGVAAEPPFMSGSNLMCWASGGDPESSDNWLELGYTTVEGRTDTHRIYFEIKEQGA